MKPKIGEIVVAVVIFGILGALLYPALTTTTCGRTTMATLSNARQIYMAAQAMAIDQGKTNIFLTHGWPGANAGFREWLTDLMAYNTNLSSHIIQKLFSATGINITQDELPEYREGKTAFRIYQLTPNSSSNAVLLSTFNWNAEAPVSLSENSVPFGKKEFILLLRGGDASIYLGKQATNPKITGMKATNIHE